MFRSFITAYKAGWRAGMCCIPRYVPLPGGLKYIAGGEELCTIPRNHRLRRQCWLQGYSNGFYKRMMQPVKKGN